MQAYTPKDRNLLAGFQFYDTTTGVLAFLMFILQLFTVTVEVFLRRDMGERHFNLVNFWAGFIVFATFGILFNAFTGLVTGGPFGRGMSSQQSSYSTLIFIVWAVYIGLGFVHFLRQWWLKGANRSVHSFHEGRSHLEPLGHFIMNVVNGLLTVPVKLLSRFIVDKDADTEVEIELLLPVFKDRYLFTRSFIEPLFLYILYVLLNGSSPIVSYWLLFSSIALLFHQNILTQIERDRVLDLHDQTIEAKYIMQAIDDDTPVMQVSHDTKMVIKNMAENIPENSPTMENMKVFNPSVAEAMAALKQRKEEKNQNETA